MYLYVYTGGTICLYCTYRRSAEERKRKESKIQCSLRVRPVSCLAAFGVENCYGYHHTSLLADMWARESGWSPTCQMTAAQTSPRLARYLSKSNQQKPPSLSLTPTTLKRERERERPSQGHHGQHKQQDEEDGADERRPPWDSGAGGGPVRRPRHRHGCLTALLHLHGPHPGRYPLSLCAALRIHGWMDGWMRECFLQSGCLTGVVVFFLLLAGQALLELKLSFNGSSQRLTTWKPTDPNPCGWEGISCSFPDLRVQSMSVSNLSLSFLPCISPFCTQIN